MNKTMIATSTLTCLLGLFTLYPVLAEAQQNNINNAGDVLVAPFTDQTKILSAEEAKKLGAQPLGTGGGAYVVQPTGIYRDIDMKKSISLIEELRGPPTPAAKKDIVEIKRRPGDYIPPVLAGMAVAEFNNGDVADAAFWLHAALLRSVLDTKLSLDRSVGDAPRFLLLQTPLPLRQAALADPVEKAKLAHAAAAWDAQTPMVYDHRWINLHGIQATMSAFDPDHAPKSLTIPQSQWPEAADKNRVEYEALMSGAPRPTPPSP